jgi:glucose-6-phosphate isomerase
MVLNIWIIKLGKNQTKIQRNLLALTWYFENDGIGSKDIVVLPYKDRLSTFPKYRLWNLFAENKIGM